MENGEKLFLQHDREIAKLTEKVDRIEKDINNIGSKVSIMKTDIGELKECEKSWKYLVDQNIKVSDQIIPLSEKVGNLINKVDNLNEFIKNVKKVSWSTLKKAIIIGLSLMGALITGAAGKEFLQGIFK